MKNIFESKTFETAFKGQILLIGQNIPSASLTKLREATKDFILLAKNIAKKPLVHGRNVYVPVILDAGKWANERLAAALVREIEGQEQAKSLAHCHLAKDGITVGIWIIFPSTEAIH